MTWRTWVVAVVFLYAALVTPAYMDRNGPKDFENVVVTWVFFALVAFTLRDKK